MVVSLLFFVRVLGVKDMWQLLQSIIAFKECGAVDGLEVLNSNYRYEKVFGESPSLE